MSILQVAGILVCAASTVLTNSSPGKTTTQLKWHRHYDMAKAVAQRAKRPLVVVIEKPDSAAEKIDDSKLTGKDRAKLTREKFELVRVDATTDYGKKVAAAFGARKFPYTAVTDQKSVRIVYRKAGQMSPKDWTLALARSTGDRLGQQRTVVQKPIVEDSTKKNAPVEIKWQSDLSTAMELAQTQKRPVFLYLTAPGCTYCEIMKQDAFKQPHIIKDVNSNFVPVQINGREQRDVSTRFHVSQYPTLVVIEPDHTVVETWNSYRSRADFEAHLKIAKSRLKASLRKPADVH